MGIISPTVQDELKTLEQEKIKYERRVSVEIQEIDQIHTIMPAMRQSFIDILNGQKPTPVDHVAKLRSRRVPVVGSVLETAKGSYHIWRAYKNYQNTWDDLKAMLGTQKWYSKRVQEQKKKIKVIYREKKELGCSP